MRAYVDSGRQTGRTTNLLEHALRLDAAGRAVYIQCGNHAGVDHIREMLKRISLEKYDRLPSSSIKLETWDSMEIMFDVRSGNYIIPGAHPRCRLLIDHFAIHLGYSGVLERFHRYDKPIPEWQIEEFSL